MPFDLLVGKYMVPIVFSAELIDLFTIRAFGTGAGFEMEADAGEVRVRVGTPGTFDVPTDVY